MLSIKGVYDGKWVIPLEKVNTKSNVKVIITFLEEESKIIISDDNLARNLPKRKAGTLQGKIHIKDSFDEPLDDFWEYME